MDIQYTRRLQKIEAVLQSWLPEKPGASWLEKAFDLRERAFPQKAPASRESPVFKRAAVAPELAESLTRPGWDLVNRGGKRWRPLLMTLAAESAAGESGAEAALPLVPLVEFSHNASLIHDDIEDHSEERRGKPAVHLLYGDDAAINGGSFMYFLPLACLSAWEENSPNPASARRIWTAWASHMRALHLGQAMDIAWHRDYLSLPGLDEYDRMCRLKTGCLARLAAVLGAYCSGADPDMDKLQPLADIFGDAAERLGVGFQILDDVKNLSGGIPGKKRGDDIVEGKKSLPVLLYLHRHPEKREFAARCFAAARAGGTGTPEAEELIRALEQDGALEEARAKGREYIRESRETFSAPEAAGFRLKKEGRELLAGLVDSIS